MTGRITVLSAEVYGAIRCDTFFRRVRFRPAVLAKSLPSGPWYRPKPEPTNCDRRVVATVIRPGYNHDRFHPPLIAKLTGPYRSMTPQQFIAKWKPMTLSEKSSAQSHFNNLCELFGQPTPTDADPDGTDYTFERGVHKTDGGNGWADVWKRGYFGWEYKGKHKDLSAAYKQLLQYREALENPPILVVCDLDRFEIHTNFTGTVKKVYAFNLDGLGHEANLDVLRRVFTDPESLKPGQTRIGITKGAAKCFERIAVSMRERGVVAEKSAHFLMKLMFCMFAEDIRLLPEMLFSNLLKKTGRDTERLSKLLGELFAQMATGGEFWGDPIPHFNGGLFADAEVIDMTWAEIDDVGVANNEHDWAEVEPTIFGTLFERFFDPTKESLIGTHFTSREDIETIVEPVVMVPLRREWAEVRAKCDALRPEMQEESKRESKAGTKSRITKQLRPGAPSVLPKKPKRTARAKFDKLIDDFIQRLSHVRILDPACGSGNFLYVCIHLLLDLEKQVILYANMHGLAQTPLIRGWSPKTP